MSTIRDNKMIPTCGKTAKRLWKRLNKELNMDIPLDSCVQKIQAGPNGKSAGAFSWVLINNDYPYNFCLGSQHSMTYLLKCPRLQIGTSFGAWVIDPVEHPREADPHEIGKKQAKRDLRNNNGFVPRTVEKVNSDKLIPSFKTYNNMQQRAECRNFTKKDWDKVFKAYNEEMQKAKDEETA